MLSLRTSSATLDATNALTRAGRAQSVAATRLSTGHRVNNASDDAAGLQIATRLATQASGTQVAMRNIQNGISLMQAADGIAEGMIAAFSRMNDLAVQAADGSTTLADRTALQEEFKSLYEHVWAQLSVKYNGERLFIGSYNGETGKFVTPFALQIGADSSAVMMVDVYKGIDTSSGFGWGSDTLATVLTENASATIETTRNAINEWAAVRSSIGAISNRLEHAYANATNLLTNTRAARGRIMDTDYAGEMAEQTTQQMLMQSGSAMLKQTHSLAQLTLSLVAS